MLLCEDILSRTTSDVTQLLIEYGCLGEKPFLTNSQEKRLDEILERAINDEVLDFWIQEIDHILAHELNLIDSTWMSEQRDWAALLREYAGISIPKLRPEVKADPSSEANSSECEDGSNCSIEREPVMA